MDRFKELSADLKRGLQRATFKKLQIFCSEDCAEVGVTSLPRCELCENISARIRGNGWSCNLQAATKNEICFSNSRF